MRQLINFATNHPAAYFTFCITFGLTIRWFWLGQDFSRFIDPLAPLFH